MNVNSITNAAHAYAASSNPKVNLNRQEATESTVGPDNDNDRDDSGSVRRAQQSPATVNFNGQSIGKNLSVSA